jgi:hypothetical protein
MRFMTETSERMSRVDTAWLRMDSEHNLMMIVGEVGVSIVSYVGGVQFGLTTDSQRCPAPQKIIERFAPEFETLLLLTLMLQWAIEASNRSGFGPWTPVSMA